MNEIIGYIALLISVLAMSRNSLVQLRSLHAVACLLYAIYGLMDEIWPLIIGGFLFLIIHSYYLLQMLRKQ